LSPNPQKGDHDTKNTLDTKFLYQLGTQPQNDSTKNDLGASEQEEEMQQPEINISMAETPTNVDPFSTSPSRTNTPPADEHQHESKSPEHTKVSPTKRIRELAMKHLYTVRSLGNTLSWEDQ
jgi:hypothetical protein